MEINIAICDDMEEFNKVLYQNLRKIEKDTNNKFDIQSYTSGFILLKKVNEGYIPDIIFLDIDLNERLLGTDFGVRIKEINPYILLIYVSNYDYYDKKIVKSEPFDFLNKPIKASDFNMVMSKAIDRISFLKCEYLYSYKAYGIIHQVNLKNVICFESQHRVINIHFKNNEINQFYGKLDDIEEEIKNIHDYFLRVNKSYLINYAYVKSISKNSIITSENIVVKISSNYKDGFLKKFHLLSKK